MASTAAESKPDRDAVLEQLDRIFASPAFKNSKRSQALFRYILRHYLEGGGDPPKERTLGIEVFDRDADYDTSTDPVVRVVAGGIRRRIAQYYHEPGHEQELRIDLPAGSYSPEIHPPLAARTAAEAVPVAPDADTGGFTERTPADSAGAAASLESRVVTPANGLIVPPPWARVRRWRLYAAWAVLLAIVGWGIGRWRAARTQLAASESQIAQLTPIDRFWAPFAGSAVPVRIELGTWSTPDSVSPAVEVNDAAFVQTSTGASGSMYSRVGWPDVVAASQVMAFLWTHQQHYVLENANLSKLNNLTQGPAVFIGGYNNPWTIALTYGLRFHFMRDDKIHWLVDRKDPSKKWMSTAGTLPGSVRQFAIIARIASPVTDQRAIVIAGVGVPATMFASGFVTSPENMNELVARLPRGWESKNIEAVITGQAVAGAPGAAHIVAVETW